MEVITDSLCQPYPLDPGSIEFLVEKALATGRDGPVAVACRLLADRALSSVERQNLGEFIRRASQSPSLHARFARATKRKGRCPKGERAWLRGQLKQPLAEPKLQTPPRVGSGPAPTVLDLSNISGALGEFPEFIDRIASVDPSGHQVAIRLNKFTYAAALAVLAEWILVKGLVQRYEFVSCPPEMSVYLENVRFSAALRNPEIRISPDPMDWAVGLTRINRDQPTELVTKKIVDIIHTFVNPSPGDREALLVLVSEMIENVHRHAETPVDGFAVAQVYPAKLKMGITLVDSGIGIRHSFETGEPSVSICNLRTDADFLREAIKLHSTSKKNRHSGYGLYLLAELVARNRGTFLLTSGRATLVGYQKNRTVTYDVYEHHSWQGTIISVILDLHREFPLLEIYREMPAIPGYEEDDLFIS